MAALIAFVLGNFTLTFLVLGIAAGLIAAARAPGGFTRANLAEGLLAYFILFTIAIAYFYNFVFHVFFGDLAASFIGWANSSFQAEVGYASLGFAAVGLLASRATAWCGWRRSSGRRCSSGALRPSTSRAFSPPATWRRATPASCSTRTSSCR
jgi:hypothetical protein